MPSVAWSSGIILALGARDPGLNSQNSPRQIRVSAFFLSGSDFAVFWLVSPLVVWSSGMILASSARGPGRNSQNSPAIFVHLINAGTFHRLSAATAARPSPARKVGNSRESHLHVFVRSTAFVDGCVASIVVGPCGSLSSVVVGRCRSLSAHGLPLTKRTLYH